MLNRYFPREVSVANLTEQVYSLLYVITTHYYIQSHCHRSHQHKNLKILLSFQDDDLHISGGKQADSSVFTTRGLSCLLNGSKNIIANAMMICQAL
jgi:hypothetical protein